MQEGLEKQKTWEDFYATYERVQALRRDVFDKAKALGDEKFSEVFDLYESHIQKIKDEFDGTVLHAAAGHALTGSSIPDPHKEEVTEEWKKFITRDDYPGEYSIENFLTALQDTIK